MEIVKKTSYNLCLDVNDVRSLMLIVNTGVKNSPPAGFDMKRAGPVIDKLKEFLKEYGREELEQDEV